MQSPPRSTILQRRTLRIAIRGRPHGVDLTERIEIAAPRDGDLGATNRVAAARIARDRGWL